MEWVWALSMMLASSVISALLQPKPTKPKPAALQDFDFPQTDEGTPQIVVFGEAWIEDWTVLWYGNLSNTPIKAKAGKK